MRAAAGGADCGRDGGSGGDGSFFATSGAEWVRLVCVSEGFVSVDYYVQNLYVDFFA